MLETVNESLVATKIDGRPRSRVITIKINGDSHEVTVRPQQMLVDVIRDTIGLTGTKANCESGSCGACTVLLNNKPVLACITLVLECDAKEVRTVEGLADGEKLSVVQEAFLDQGAIQCGFCTPGMLMSVTALLEQTPRPSRTEINKALEGNLCRCTGYNSIIDAILQASGQQVKASME